MKVKIYNIPIPGGEEMTEEMNKFLAGKRIIHIENQVVLSGQLAFWTFCVKYLEKDLRA